MVNFYIADALDQNLANSESALFWDCSKRQKSVISGDLPKNGYVWATQWSTSSENKIKFNPSLDSLFRL